MFHRSTRTPSSVPPIWRGWFWELGGAGTLGLVVPQTGELRVVRGRVWVTTGDAAHGDHVLGPGDSLHMRALQRLVVENWSRHDPARIEWLTHPGPAQRDFSRPAGGPWWLRGLADGWRLRAL